jgi:2-C-methyl-D-erythritol 4-phosphate cytidylyltransferase
MDKFIFESAGHAIKWLSQPYILNRKDSYKLEVVLFTRARCCGHKNVIKILQKKMTYDAAIIALQVATGDIKHVLPSKQKAVRAKRRNTVRVARPQGD